MTTTLHVGPIKQAGVAEEAILIETLTLLRSACFFLDELLGILIHSLQFFNSSPETKLIYRS